MGKHAARRWSPRIVRRVVWIVVLGVAAFMLTLVVLLFQSFKDDEPHDPAQARTELQERTPEEVGASREKVEELEATLTTEPEPLAQEETLVEDLPEPDEPEPEVQEAEELPGSVDSEVEAEDAISVANAHSPGLPDGMFDAVMLVGADASGYLADTIILALFPEDGSAPALISIPRDLYLYNFCSEDYRRVNANLGGCTGYANGPELLSLAIEEFTGVEVDHYVRVNFEGFVELVDGLGGVEVCFEYPTYDEKAGLDIPEPSCRTDGATALAYARSRNASQLVDGEWQQAWSSDFSRQQHQRELLLKLAGQLRNSSVAALGSSLQSLSHTFRLDRGWSIAEAVEWLWRYRSLDPSQVTQLRIPVMDYRTSEGAQVLLPAQTFNSVLSRWWGPTKR
ncbi:MAG: LCP family protein [bacterium]|nr:LCP family protein [bacterium]